MEHADNRSYALESVAGPEDPTLGRHVDGNDFADLESAVSALTGDDFSSLSSVLNAADAWDIDDTGGHCGGGFLANQF